MLTTPTSFPVAPECVYFKSFQVQRTMVLPVVPWYTSTNITLSQKRTNGTNGTMVLKSLCVRTMVRTRVPWYCNTIGTMVRTRVCVRILLKAQKPKTT
jgi:hypothetical protein